MTSEEETVLTMGLVKIGVTLIVGLTADTTLVGWMFKPSLRGDELEGEAAKKFMVGEVGWTLHAAAARFAEDERFVGIFLCKPEHKPTALFHVEHPSVAEAQAIFRKVLKVDNPLSRMVMVDTGTGQMKELD